MSNKAWFGFVSIVFLIVISGCAKKHSRSSGDHTTGGEIRIPEGGTGGGAGSAVGESGGMGGEGGLDERVAGSGGELDPEAMAGAGGELVGGDNSGGAGGELEEPQDRQRWLFELDNTLPNACEGVPTLEPEPQPLADNHIVLPAIAGLSSFAGGGTNCNFTNEYLGSEGKIKKTFVKWTPDREGTFTFTTLYPLGLFQVRLFRDCTDENSVLFDSGPRDDYELFPLSVTGFPIFNHEYKTHGRIVVGPAEVNQPIYFSLETKCSVANRFFQLVPANIHIVHTENPTPPEFISEPLAWFSPSTFSLFRQEVGDIAVQKDFHLVLNVRDPNMRIQKAHIRFFADDAAQEPLPLDLPFKKVLKIEPLNNLPQSLYEDPVMTPVRAGGYLALHELIENLSPSYFENAQRVEVVIFNDENQEILNRRLPIEPEPPTQNEGELCYPNQTICQQNHVCRDAEDRVYRCMPSSPPRFGSIELIQHPTYIAGVVEILDDTFDVTSLAVDLYASADDDDPLRYGFSLEEDNNPFLESVLSSQNLWNPDTQESQRKSLYRFTPRLNDIETVHSLILRAMDSSGLASEQQIFADQINEAPVRQANEPCDFNETLDRCTDGLFCVEHEGEHLCKTIEPVEFSSFRAIVDQEAKLFEIHVDFEEPIEEGAWAPWGYTYSVDLVGDRANADESSLDFSPYVFNRYVFDDEGNITGAVARNHWRYNSQNQGSFRDLELFRLDFGLVDRFGFRGEQLPFIPRVVWEEGALLERPYPGCLLDEDCEEGFVCRDQDGDNGFECIEDVPPTISNLEVWLTNHGKNLFLDVQGQNPQIVNTTINTLVVTNPLTSSQVGNSFAFGLPVNFVETSDRLDIDEDGNYHWQILIPSNFFRDSNIERGFFNWEYHLGNFDAKRFFTQFNRAEIYLDMAEAVAESEIQFAETLNVGQACDANDFRRECETGSTCADPSSEVFGDGICTASEDVFSECPPDILFDDISTDVPLLDEGGNPYFESRAAPTNDRVSVACSLDDLRNVRVYRFVAPEAGHYLFSTGHNGFNVNPDTQSMAIRTHCADEQTELACLPYAANGNGRQALFLEADEQVFVFLANYFGREQILNSNFRIYPYEPNRILAADEVADGQQAPVVRYVQDEPTIELYYTLDNGSWGSSDRAYIVEFLNEDGAVLSTDSGENEFTFRDRVEIGGAHMIQLPLETFVLLQRARSLRIRVGLWHQGSIPSEPFAFAEQAVDFQIEQAQPEVSQEGEECFVGFIPSERIHCTEGTFCGQQIDAVAHACSLHLSSGVCTAIPEGCSLDQCPADWTVTSLNDFERAEAMGSQWLYEGSLHPDDRAGAEPEFHGIADCLDDSNNDLIDEATGYNDLLSFTAPSTGTYNFTLNPAVSKLKLSIRDHCILREDRYCNHVFNSFYAQHEYLNIDEVYEMELQANQTVYLLVDSKTAEDRKAYSLTAQKLSNR